jgi:hypothetical protein
MTTSKYEDGHKLIFINDMGAGPPMPTSLPTKSWPDEILATR